PLLERPPRLDRRHASDRARRGARLALMTHCSVGIIFWKKNAPDCPSPGTIFVGHCSQPCRNGERSMAILLMGTDALKLKSALKDAGYAVDAAREGRDADRKALGHACDVIVLDLDSLLHGASHIQEWRRRGVDCPILALCGSRPDLIRA